MASDEELAHALQRGDATALEELVTRYYAPLLRFLFRMTGGHQSDAEDLLQETCVRMMCGIQSYSPARPFKPWLYTIARNVAYNYMARAEQRQSTGSLPEAAASPQALPEERLVMREQRSSIMQALAQLPVKQREAIILFYYDELPQKEIAALLHIPVGTVKSRLSLGLRQLRHWLKEHI